MHISYVLISTLTFPGVILHELGHKIFCHLTGVRVIKTCLFRFGNPCGYVKYEMPSRYIQSFFIAVGPLITNTAFALLSYWISNMVELKIEIALIWLGGSIAMHAFPSSVDGKTLWQDTNRHVKHNFLVIFAYPFSLIILLASVLRRVLFDLIYAVALYLVVNPWFWEHVS
jgi:hypothetical protein